MVRMSGKICFPEIAVLEGQILANDFGVMSLWDRDQNLLVHPQGETFRSQ